jgi:hypothetical protein
MKFSTNSSGQRPLIGLRLNASPKCSDRMDLSPKLPPGRANRKALAYACEIDRLRVAGYSFEAIRVALLDAGVKVSRSTVKREVAKGCAVAKPAPQRHSARASEPAARSAIGPVLTAPAPFAGDPRSGKEIAEAFMKGRVGNPLMKESSRDESRSD